MCFSDLWNGVLDLGNDKWFFAYRSGWGVGVQKHVGSRTGLLEELLCVLQDIWHPWPWPTNASCPSAIVTSKDLCPPKLPVFPEGRYHGSRTQLSRVPVELRKERESGHTEVDHAV